MALRYDLDFKTEFWFERTQRAEVLAKLPLRFVWGVSAVDNGNYLDPTNKGNLVLDSTFNVAAPESQEWLSSFCRDIRHQPFFQATPGLLLPNCFIETFQSWMKRPCKVKRVSSLIKVYPRENKLSEIMEKERCILVVLRLRSRHVSRKSCT